jgi:ParB-like chromosome segregation protein Spo0J
MTKKSSGKKTIFLEDPSEVVLNVHQVMPDLAPDDREALKESIRQRGVINPILLDEQKAIVDGHNRVHVWAELLAEGVNIGQVVAHIIPGLDKYSAHEIAIETNVGRRQLTPTQKRQLIRNELRFLADKYSAEGYTGENTRSWDSKRIARLLGVGVKTVRDERIEAEKDKAIPYANHLMKIAYQPSTGTREEYAQIREGSSKGAKAPFDEDPVLIKVEIPTFADDGSIASKQVLMLTPEEVTDRYRKLAEEADTSKKTSDAETRRLKEEQKRLNQEYANWFAKRGEKAEKPLFATDPEEWAEQVEAAYEDHLAEAKAFLRSQVNRWIEVKEYEPSLMVEAILNYDQDPKTYVQNMDKLLGWYQEVHDELAKRRSNPIQAVK